MIRFSSITTDLLNIYKSTTVNDNVQLTDEERKYSPPQIITYKPLKLKLERYHKKLS